MKERIRLLPGPGGLRALGHALDGAALSLPPAAGAAVVAAAADRARPAAWQGAGVAVVFAVVFAVLVAAAGAPSRSRRACVRRANRLLGFRLPEPAGIPDARARNRVRTFLWLGLHMTLGWLVIAVTGLLSMAAVVVTGVWLGGGDRVSVFVPSLEVPGGLAGAWAPFAGIAALFLTVHVCAWSAVVFDRLAHALLGPGPAERLAAAEERMRRLAERNRLARELHDSIGHTLTASTIQAAVAAEVMEADPDMARRALGSIEESSRSALDDLDHVLGVLREGTASPLPPQHTLGDLDTLIEGVRRTGTEVSVDVHGDRARVPAAVSREAYRVIQEGLTNALRHAPRAPITLRVAVVGDLLEVDIGNPLPARRGPVRARRGGGLGLPGIDERVRLLRGEIHAGAGPDGHWRLTSRIPLRSVP